MIQYNRNTLTTFKTGVLCNAERLTSLGLFINYRHLNNKMGNFRFSSGLSKKNIAVIKKFLGGAKTVLLDGLDAYNIITIDTIKTEIRYYAANGSPPNVCYRFKK